MMKMLTTPRHKIIKIISLIGILHFATSIFIWGFACYVALRINIHEWNELLDAIPAVILFLLFLIAFISASKNIRVSTLILVLAILLACIAFTYDAVNHNYQWHVENIGGDFHYFTWWWYSND